MRSATLTIIAPGKGGAGMYSVNPRGKTCRVKHNLLRSANYTSSNYTISYLHELKTKYPKGSSFLSILDKSQINHTLFSFRQYEKGSRDNILMLPNLPRLGCPLFVHNTLHQISTTKVYYKLELLFHSPQLPDLRVEKVTTIPLVQAYHPGKAVWWSHSRCALHSESVLV